MEQMKTLEKEIETIKQRNEKVTEDKAWETSKTRRVFLVVFTYVAIGLYLRAIGVSDPWLNAIVPSLGYLLSTLTLPFIKRLWSAYLYNK